MRKSLSAAAVAMSVLTLAACSGTSTQAGSGPDASDSAGATTSPALVAAQAYLDKHSETPTSIGDLTPLSKKPAGAKFLVGLGNGTDDSNAISDYWKEAAASLGWKYKALNAGFTPESQQKAFETALSLNPDGILGGGILASTLKKQLADAASKNVAVLMGVSTDKASPTGFFDTSVGGPEQLREWGKMVAAQVAVQSKGRAKIQMFTLPVYPILTAYDDGFKAAIIEYCPKCTIRENPQQGSDIGSKTPGAVVSAVQKAPDTTWISFDLGQSADGVNAALAAAGMTGKVRIGGLSGTKANRQALKDGKQDVWTGFANAIVAYRGVDNMARHFNGDPIASTPLPTQVITRANVGSIVLDTKGDYVGVADYKAQFMKLWQVS